VLAAASESVEPVPVQLVLAALRLALVLEPVPVPVSVLASLLPPPLALALRLDAPLVPSTSRPAEQLLVLQPAELHSPLLLRAPVSQALPSSRAKHQGSSSLAVHL
jgi:hypothetical protein